MIHKKILLCTDFSDNSAPAKQMAVQYAKLFGAELLILHVVRPVLPSFMTFEGALNMDATLVDRQIQETASIELERTAEECRSDVSDVSFSVRVGSAADAVVRFADEESVDLIVLGTHGWTGFRHLILGSTAEKVVRTANCPVLSVRSPGED
jgi:nucleotide-binding universal stress UspA family protein